MSRSMHFEFHRGGISVIDDGTGQLVYVGGMSTGGAMGNSTCNLSRPANNNHPEFPIGSITWHAGSGRFELQLASGRPVSMHHGMNILSRKTTLGSSQGELTWKGDGMLHTSLKLVNGGGMETAHLGDLMNISNRNMGRLQVMGAAAVDGEFMDEVVLSAVGMLMQEKATELSAIILGAF